MNSNSGKVDAVVVGAGWAGLYMAHRLQQLELNVRVLEAGSGVGGTWFWNRYPGARCDIPSLNYCYSLPEIYKDWVWTERYAGQEEIERYANYVADTLDVRRLITFNTSVERLRFNEAAHTWRIETNNGESIEARWVFMAVGGYSAPLKPNIPGLDSFSGELYYTQRWPEHAVSFKGKRIGVIGTGSSGIQTITEIGRRAEFDKLYVFQRTANFAVPSVNYPMEPADQEEFKKNYEEFWAQVRESGSGTFRDIPPTTVADMSDDAFEAYMGRAWKIGGPGVTLGIADLMTSKAANERVAEYLRAKLRQRVKDPKVADMLTPRGFFIGARRVACETGYYEVFNQPNVTLVDVKADPIERFTENALVTAGGRRFEMDMLILATGFDSGTGAWLRVDITGRDGAKLADRWAGGPLTYLGIAVSGFPNMFGLAAPGSPSIRGNVLVSIEQHVEWLTGLMQYALQHDIDIIEATPAAEADWTKHVARVADSTLLTHDDTQYMGANVPGKPRVYLAYAGGLPVYRIVCDAIRKNGYEGFTLSRDGEKINAGSPDWSGLPKEAAPRMRYGALVI
jgi:cation diffusion facilitator CzcD-associated flavoprotein CzcO